MTMIAILVCMIVIIGLFVMNALAQTTPPLQTHGNGSSQATQRQPIAAEAKKGISRNPQ